MVQLCFNFNNLYFPRDSKDQLRYLSKKVKKIYTKKNDLFFWKGHIAVCLSRKKLIHAYGPYKKVIEMNIEKTIKKIKKDTGLKLVAIKRIEI